MTRTTYELAIVAVLVLIIAGAAAVLAYAVKSYRGELEL